MSVRRLAEGIGTGCLDTEIDFPEDEPTFACGTSSQREGHRRQAVVKVLLGGHVICGRFFGFKNSKSFCQVQERSGVEINLLLALFYEISLRSTNLS